MKRQFTAALCAIATVTALAAMCGGAPPVTVSDSSDLAAENRALRDALTDQSAKNRALDAENARLKAELNKLRDQLNALRTPPNTQPFRFELPSPLRPAQPPTEIPKSWIPHKFNGGQYYVIPLGEKSDEK